MIRKITIVTSIIVAIATFGYVLGAYSLIARAAISAFYPSTCYTAAATSSPAYMSPGLATSTVECNLGGDGARTAVVRVQANATSTATTFNFYVEESMDSIDWYPITQEQTSSTTNPFNVGVRAYTTFTFASTTIGGTSVALSGNRLGVSGENNRNHYTFEVPVRERYVRVYAGLTGAGGAVWMHILPRVDVN